MQILVYLVCGYASFTILLFQGILIFLQDHHPLSHHHHFTWSCLALCAFNRSGGKAAINESVLPLGKSSREVNLIKLNKFYFLETSSYCPRSMASLKSTNRSSPGLKPRSLGSSLVFTWVLLCPSYPYFQAVLKIGG